MILAVDTATRWTGISLYDGDAVAAEMGWYAINTQTVELAPTVADMLRKTNVKASELKGIVVAIGPGSYTGLRVGMGFAKGMALAYKIPLVGVATHEIIVAAFGPSEDQLVVVAEAGRKRVSAAIYRWYSRKGWQIKVPADIYDWATLLEVAKEGSQFVGEVSAESRKLVKSAEKEFKVIKPAASARRAGHLAELGHVMLRKGKTIDAASVTPVYLRDPGGAKPAAK